MPLFKPSDIENMQAKKDIEGLVRALGYKEDYYVRMDAARALGKIGDPRAVEPLIAALKDEELNVRKEAAGALESLHRSGKLDESSRAKIVAALKNTDMPHEDIGP